MSVDYFEVVMTADGLQFIPMTETLKRGPAQNESKRCEPDENNFSPCCQPLASQPRG
jgi:hypothetical protein